MAHAEWCGKCKCGDCPDVFNCALDMSMPCSPSCELLGEDGFPRNPKACEESGCDAYEWDKYGEEE